MKKILLYGIHGTKRDAVDAVCSRLQIQIVELQVSDTGRSLGELAGIGSLTEKAVPGKGALPFFAEFLVFSGFRSEDLDFFLEEYRKEGAAAIPLKAVLTPVNLSWTPGRLYEELSSERAALSE